MQTPSLHYCFTTQSPREKPCTQKIRKPLSRRTMLYLVGVLSALLWNKVLTNYGEKRCLPLYGRRQRNPASFCLPPVCTFYTITCHHLTTLAVLIFTIHIINSKMRLLPFCRQESEIKWQRDMPDLMEFWFQMRRGQHWGNYSPMRQDSTEESICCLTLCQKPNNWYCHIYENSSGLCAWKKKKKKGNNKRSFLCTWNMKDRGQSQ